ncbi:hypothetical protein PC9H_004959 [Pleurotus ostreatus]|nr:uncharacterized protein PC9H_004959 [Pleurotus ostreatus]KAF7433014.1 hypothetical protein PC9H_004959 [Pleurotus ostreatus]
MASPAPRGRGGGRGARGGGGGGAGRGGGGRGGGGARGGRGGGGAGAATGSLDIASHVQTVGVKRPSYGTAGRPVTVIANAFETPIPGKIIRHYDVIEPSEKVLPARVNNDIIKQLQNTVAPEVFTPKGVYDGRKNIFFTQELAFGPNHSKTFDVTLTNGGNVGTRPPKVYKVTLTLAQEINPEVLDQFIHGQQSHGNDVLIAITALNVAVRMKPNQCHPFNVRSFFTDRERRDLGAGIEIWRGYFQSVRPVIGRMIVNVDISTGFMYKRGSLIGLCLDFFGRQDPNILSPKRGLPDRERLRLQRFLSGLRITTSHTHGGTRRITRVVKKLSTAGARDCTFTLREGGSSTVADYFARTVNRPLQYPDVLCIEVGNGALIPLELCDVPPGQIMRKQVPSDKIKDVLAFSTMKPAERFQSIRSGFEALSYTGNEYLDAFEMTGISQTPLNVNARVLQATRLKYGASSKQPTIQPTNGAWNLVDKRFFEPTEIERWVIVIYEQQRRFGQQNVDGLINGLKDACRSVGMKITNDVPIVKYENGQGNIANQLKAAGGECVKKYKGPPNLIVVVLPDNNTEIYTAVKHFGDIMQGVATQCLISSKCSRAKMQYYANVCLKINVKLGGINAIPDPQSAAVLTDPHNPTIIMGADVIHPAPGSEGRPSFTSLVGSVDSNAAKYVADTRVQAGRTEMIEDLQAMVKHVLTMYMSYREKKEKVGSASIAPKRLIFYRDGVSEGEFAQVLEKELPRIRAACVELKIRPKITIIVVGKRHHMRFNTIDPRDADRSGNCPAGMVVDRDIAHPSEFDWYLLSHGGLLGTSRPSHYSVLHDDNAFSPDALQALSFALCHVYARATRSVSIPAPVYYADIVCARAKNHYDPQGSMHLSDSATQLSAGQADASVVAFRQAFRPLHNAQRTLMYFS